MEYKEIDVFVSPEFTDVVSLILCDCGSQGSVIHDEETYDDLIRITAYFPADDDKAEPAIRQGMKALQERNPRMGRWHIMTRKTSDSDWLYRWQDYFHATKISPRLWVSPSWETAEPGPVEAVIRIDPGVAFGSGLHATTAMCVSYLEQVIQPGQLVYDIGTGTGILAIAAARLGAGHVTAVDLDQKAVDQAVVNVELNELSDCVEVMHSDLLGAISDKGEKADVVTANLVTNAVLSLLPDLGSYTHAGSYVIVSGIIDDRIGEIRDMAGQTGYEWVSDTLQDGWYAVLLRRN